MEMQMTIDKGVRVVAGLLILVSVALTAFVSPYWILLTAFIGVNLIQSAFTGFCPAEMILKRVGLSGGCCARE